MYKHNPSPFSFSRIITLNSLYIFPDKLDLIIFVALQFAFSFSLNNISWWPFHVSNFHESCIMNSSYEGIAVFNHFLIAGYCKIFPSYRLCQTISGLEKGWYCYLFSVDIRITTY